MSGGFGGFRDEDEDFGDLLSKTTFASSSSMPSWSTSPDSGGLVEDLSSNPFSDMESSSVYVAPSFTNAEPAPTSLYSPSSPTTESRYRTDPYAATTPSSPPRGFSRESAPEPESPTYNRRRLSSSAGSTGFPRYTAPTPSSPTALAASPLYSIPPVDEQTPFGSPPASPTSPGASGHGRVRSKADMLDLLGEEKPILPTFSRREASAAANRASVLPVSSIGNRSVDGPLAALLGLAGEDQLVQPKPKSKPASVPEAVAAIPTLPVPTSTTPSQAQQAIPPPKEPIADEPTPVPEEAIMPPTPKLPHSTNSPIPTSASATPLPPSPPGSRSATPALLGQSLSRRPSLSRSNTSLSAYESMVSPLDTGDIDAKGWPGKDVSSEPSELDKRLAGLRVDDDDASNESTPTASGSLPTPARPSTPPTSMSSPSQSPFATIPTSPTRQGLFDSAPSSANPNRGFRSYNGSLDEGGGGFGGHADDTDSLRGTYSRSVEVEGDDATETETATGRSSPVTERDGSFRTVSQEDQFKGGLVSPPLPSVPLHEPEVKPPAPTFIISVGDPQKIGSSLNVTAQHTVYTVRTQTTSSSFRKQDFSVLRRFSHFLWLFDALTANNPGVIVPGMPEKNAIGRFGSEFVENRRTALQAALMKIVAHPMLVGDPDLRLFLESDSFSVEIKQRKIEAPAENQGFFASFSSSISGPKFIEFDDFFDERRLILDTFEAQLRSVLSSFAAAAKLRAAFQLSLGELQSAFLGLSQCDLSGPLRNALEQAANLQRRLREISEQQSQSEEQIGGLTSVAEGYARLCGSVKLVFGARIKSYHAWQAADSALWKAKVNHEKAKKSGRTHSELLGLSVADISEAERKMLDAKQDFEDVSKLTKAEMARFDKEKIEDFKKAITAYVEGMVVRQREVVRLWQQYEEVLQRATASNSQLALPAPEQSSVSS